MIQSRSSLCAELVGGTCVFKEGGLPVCFFVCT